MNDATYTPATEPRAGLPPIPDRMKKLPLDHRGYCVPWFVAWVNGRPDFRVMEPKKWEKAIRFGNCWLCGEPVGRLKTFVLGPMCTVSRTTSEPPNHFECANFAVRACPFMTLPAAQYRESNLPDGIKAPAGMGLTHNPTVTALWTTESFTTFTAPGGTLVTVGPPKAVLWYHRGRPATREEVMEGMSIGLPKVRAMAEAEGGHAIKAFDRALETALLLLPR